MQTAAGFDLSDKDMSYRPRYMGRIRSIPGDPPRVRLRRESFESPASNITRAELGALRTALRNALAVIDKTLNR